jgi:hypothetical protein
MTIYVRNCDNSARYALGEIGRRPLVVLGVNPSTATDVCHDKTVAKVVGFSTRHGFDGWLMLNIYPQRATNPSDLGHERHEEWHSQNIIEIRKLVSSLRRPTIWAAWGDVIEKRRFLLDCLCDIVASMEQYRPKWCHMGTLTQKGHPRHPSRLAYAVEKARFAIVPYLKTHQD